MARPSWKSRALDAEDSVLKLVGMNQEMAENLDRVRGSFGLDGRGRYVIDALRRADELLERLGWRPCNAAACNCGGYHEDPSVDWKSMYEYERDQLAAARYALAKLDRSLEISTRGTGSQELDEDEKLHEQLRKAAVSLGWMLPETEVEVAQQEALEKQAESRERATERAYDAGMRDGREYDSAGNVPEW